MFPAALMYQNGKLGMHCPPNSVCQNFWTGLQLKTTTSTCEKAHITIIAPVIQITLFILYTPSTR